MSNNNHLPDKTISHGASRDLRKLKRAMRISPKTVVAISEAPLKIEFGCDSAVIDINIGEHTGYLIMSLEAFEEFQDGTEVETRTSASVIKTINK